MAEIPLCVGVSVHDLVGITLKGCGQGESGQLNSLPFLQWKWARWACTEQLFGSKKQKLQAEEFGESATFQARTHNEPSLILFLCHSTLQHGLLYCTQFIGMYSNSKWSCTFRNCETKGKERVFMPYILKMHILVSLLPVSDSVTMYVYEVVNISWHSLFWLHLMNAFCKSLSIRAYLPQPSHLLLFFLLAHEKHPFN